MNGQPTAPLLGRSRRRKKGDWSDELEFPDPSVVLGFAIVDGIQAGCAVLHQLSEDPGVPHPDEVERVGLGSPLDRLRTFLIQQEAMKHPGVQNLKRQRGDFPISLRDRGQFSRMKEIFLGKIIDSAVKSELEAAANGEVQKQTPIVPRHVFSVPERDTFLPFDPWQGVVGEPYREGDEEESSIAA